MSNLKFIKPYIIVFISFVVINILSNKIFKRFDVTLDHRYTLSEASKNIISEIDSPLIIDVFLEGDLNPDFKKLSNETKFLLEEYSAFNNNISFTFLDPLEDVVNRDKNIQNLFNRGLAPVELSVKIDGKLSQELVFPWALVSYNGETKKINLLKENLNSNEEQIISNSIGGLEYSFSDSIKILSTPKEERKKIANLKGNSQFNDIYVADFLSTINQHYRLAAFTLDSVSKAPKKTLEELKKYDLIISAGPNEKFTDEEKFVLDQYQLNGGKSLWLTENILINKDSLNNSSLSNVVFPKDLNLNDYFFSYGLRINPNLISSKVAGLIEVAKNSNNQYVPKIFPYYPLGYGNKSVISNNLNPVKFDFASQIDTLKNTTKKTILLQTSPLSKIKGNFSSINLSETFRDAAQGKFNEGPQNTAVLINGNFTSVFKNKLKPFKIENTLDNGDSKMIVISDSEVIKNDIIKGEPQTLGYDKWTGQSYGNKEFLLNCVNFLLDDTGLIDIRNKYISLVYLNPEKIVKNKSTYQFAIYALTSLYTLFIFGVVYFVRKKIV